MSLIITIQGTPVTIPTSGQSPDWSSGIIQALQLLAVAVNGVTGTFDIPAQTFDIDNYNPGTNIVIPNLAFSNIQVRGAYIRYSVYRNTSTTTVSQIGQLDIIYNPTNPTNNKWEISSEQTGVADISFTISDTGQVSFSTTALSGTSHQGTLTFLAQTLQQT